MECSDGNLIHIIETDSTNRYLQLLLKNKTLADETVVWTDYQTAGRGQPGNIWESEAGKNLTCSLLYYPKELPANQPFIIAELASLSVKAMLDQYIDDVNVKWPNDVYWKDRKICGILIENQLSGRSISHSVIGMGINLNQDVFYSDAPNPVSLKQITGFPYIRTEILKQLISAFRIIRKHYEVEGADFIHQKYLNALYRRDGFHWFSDNNGLFEGCIHHVELSGQLVLERKNGVISTYAFKEVAFK